MKIYFRFVLYKLYLRTFQYFYQNQRQIQMERTTFMDYLFQKNQKLQSRKLSQASPASSHISQPNKYLVNTQSYSQYNQLPAFINRKVKNLKPYTNIKRFTVQSRDAIITTKQDLTKKKIDVGIQSKKHYKIQKYDQEYDAIFTPKVDSTIKVPQICIYQQFLQKSKSKFTNFVNYTKNSHKDQYNREIKAHEPKFKAFPRRSLGTQLTQQQLMIQQKQSLMDSSSKTYTKSVNQLVRGCDEVVTTKEVIILSKINKLEGVSNSIITQKDYKKMTTQNIKNSNLFSPAPYRQKQQISISNTNNKFQNQHQHQQQQRQKLFKATNSITKYTNNKKQQKSLQEAISVNLSKNVHIGQTSAIKKQAMNNKNNKSINSKKEIRKQNKDGFNVNIIDKYTFDTQITSPSKKNINNQLSHINQQTQILPPNVSAYSYIIYQPDFSKNITQKIKQTQTTKSNKMFNNCKIHSAINGKNVCQIASLTKIMTCMVIIQICQRFKLVFEKETIRIGKFQSNINGTSAQIQEGQIYTVLQLCYGLMLPSGNDASLALAVYGGKKLLSNQIRTSKKYQKSTSMNFSTKQAHSNGSNNNLCNTAVFPQSNLFRFKKKKCYQRFILQMNKKARLLGMGKTNYANSHGLANSMNKSCAYDLVLLCEYAMKNLQFKKIVSTKVYEGVIEVQQEIQIQTLVKPQTSTTNSQQRQPKIFSSQKPQVVIPPSYIQKKSFHNYQDDVQHQNQNDTQQSEDLDNSQKDQHQLQYIKTTRKEIVYNLKKIKWENTQKLLEKNDYIGIKTGITTSAGPCLASCVQTQDGRFFIIVVLNCKKINYRFKDTQTLRKWVFKKQGIRKIKTPTLIKKLQEEESQSDPQ